MAIKEDKQKWGFQLPNAWQFDGGNNTETSETKQNKTGLDKKERKV